FFPSKRRHGSRIRGTLMCSAPGGIRLALSKGKHGLAEDCRAVGVHVGTAAQLRSIPTGAVRGGGVFGAARGADAAALAPCERGVAAEHAGRPGNATGSHAE